MKFYGYTGVYLGFLIETENKTSFTTTSFPEVTVYDESYDPTDIFYDQVFGGLIGIGVKIPLCEKVQLVTDVRYSAGLTKATKNTEYEYDPNHYTRDTPDNFQDVHNRTLTLSFGILYTINNL